MVLSPCKESLAKWQVFSNMQSSICSFFLSVQCLLTQNPFFIHFSQVEPGVCLAVCLQLLLHSGQRPLQTLKVIC